MFQIKLFCLIGLSLTPAERTFTKLPIKTVFWIKNALVAILVVEALALLFFMPTVLYALITLGGLIYESS